MYDKRHEDQPFHDGKELIWSDKPTKVTPFHYRDGVTIWLSPTELNPDDKFLG